MAVKRAALGTTTSVVSGHISRFMSAICSIFLHRGGTIECIVVGARKHSSDLPQGGLEVPCLLKFKTCDAKECSRTNMLLISSISEFPEGGSVQSSCTLCTGNSYAKPTNNKFIDSSLSLWTCSDSMNATIYSHSTSMQSSAIQTAISSEKVIEMLSDDEYRYDTSDEEETTSTVKKRKPTSVNSNIDLEQIIMGEKLSNRNKLCTMSSKITISRPQWTRFYPFTTKKSSFTSEK